MPTPPPARAGHPAMALGGGDGRVQSAVSSPSRRRDGERDIAGRDGAGAATVAVTGADLGSGVGAGAGVGAAAGAGVGAADGTAAARTLFEARGTNRPGCHVHPSPRVMPATATATTAAATTILPTRRASGGRPSRLRMAAFTVSTSTFRCRPANAVLSARSHRRLMTRGTPPL